MPRQVVVLSSSPPRLPDVTVTPPSAQNRASRTFVPSTSSPTSEDLPSLSQLLKDGPRREQDAPRDVAVERKSLDKRLKPGSRALPIPDGAFTGFMSVNGLIKTHRLSVEFEGYGSSQHEANYKPKTKRSVHAENDEATGKEEISSKRKVHITPCGPSVSKDIDNKGVASGREDLGDRSKLNSTKRPLRDRTTNTVRTPIKESNGHTKSISKPEPNNHVNYGDAKAIQSDMQDAAGQAHCSITYTGEVVTISNDDFPRTGVAAIPANHGPNGEKTAKVTRRRATKKTSTTSEYFKAPPKVLKKPEQEPLVEVPQAVEGSNPYTWIQYLVRPPAEGTMIIDSQQEEMAGEPKPGACKKKKEKSLPNLQENTKSESVLCLSKDRVSRSTSEALTRDTPLPRRKRTWTPPRDDSFVDISTLENRLPSSNSNLVAGPTTSFASIVQSFEYESVSPSKASDPNAPAEIAPLKRKLLELIPPVVKNSDGPDALKGVGQSKPTKSPLKKRPKTVTGFAIQGHQPSLDDIHDDQSVSNLFAPTPVKGPRPTAAEPPMKSNGSAESTRRKVEKVSKPVKVTSKKNSKRSRVNRLSPQALAERMGRQNLVFGTSSQLKLDEDPETLRRIQQAVRESEIASTSNSTQEQDINHFSAKRKSRRLWAVASNDVEDDAFALLLEQSKAPLKRPNNTDQANTLERDRSPQQEFQGEERKGGRGGFNTPPPLHQPYFSHRGNPTEQSQEVDIFEKNHMPTSPVNFEAAQPSIALLRSNVTPATAGSTTITDAVSRRAISTKALLQRKPRGRPPKLKPSPQNPGASAADIPEQTLQKMKSSTLPEPNDSFIHIENLESMANDKPGPDGRPQKTKPISNPTGGQTQDDIGNRGKVRKARKPKQDKASTPAPSTPRKKWRTIDEIEDSEPDLTPSPPRRSTGKSPPLPLLVSSRSASAELEPLAAAGASTKPCGSRQSSHPAWPAMAAELYPKITRAVKDEPPSSGGAPMTWHEKMLLYDPIVADDLAAWLNARGVIVRDLSRPERSSRNPRDRKREGSNAEAAERVRNLDQRDEGEGGMVPLEPWMVRCWCEENSVCAVLRESLGPRQRRKRK